MLPHIYLIKAFYIVGFVIGLINAVLFLLLGVAVLTTGVLSIVFYYLKITFVTEWLIEGLANGYINSSFPGDYETQALFIEIMFSSIGLTYILMAPCFLIGSIFSIVGENKFSKKMCITNIVISVLFGNKYALVASILGLIYIARENRRLAQN